MSTFITTENNESLVIKPDASKSTAFQFQEVDLRPIAAALLQLAELNETLPAFAEMVAEQVGDAVEWIRVERRDATAGWTGQGRLIFQPSDRLVEFLAAFGTVERN